MAYLGNFDPTNISANYLADAGDSVLPGSAGPVTFSFTLPAAQTVVLAIHAVDPATNVGATYSVTVAGLPESFVVTKTADTNDGVCDADCSLREAIVAANTNANPVVADTISFNIPGGGVQTITLASAPPDVAEPVIIDGYTQPGATPNTLAVGTNALLKIELRGISFPLTLRGGNSVVQGLVINRFTSSSSGAGIILRSSNNVVQGNFIGTDATGTLEQGNAISGVVLVVGADDNLVGGISPAARNLISGNGEFGIFNNFASNTLIQGNLIGTNASGTAALANASGGILARRDDGITNNGITIGGTLPGAGNLISGNSGNGIAINGASNSSVQGNLIGTNATGTAALGNAMNGVTIANASANIIGGTALGARNVISANGGGGIVLTATAVNPLVQGNFIGTDASGAAALGNTGNGITSSAANSTLGGSAAGAGNTIAFNTGNGVSITGGSGNQIFGNSISSNTQLGIDLVLPGETGGQVTSNDYNDPDAGPNNGQNYPTLSAITQSGTTTSVTGTFNSSPNLSFALDFYSNSVASASGFGEGEKYLGSANVTTDFRGDAPFAFPLSGVSAGQFITATATDGTTRDTSEFSNALLVQFAGRLQFAQPNFAAQEGSGNATITISRSGGTDGAVSVNYATNNGTAIAGSDYISTSGTLNFAAGQSSATFTIPITDDAVVENDETVNLTLSNASGGAGLGAPISATLAIVDNDSPQPGNASPVADEQSRTTPRNTALAITLTGRDSDTPPTNLIYRIVTPPQNGALSGTAPNLTYTPKSDFLGPDSFAFVINDGNSDSNLATIHLQVLAGTAPPSGGQPPVAQAQSVTTDQNTPITIVLKATDADTPAANLTYRLVTAPTHGTLSGTIPNLTYTPTNNYSGSDSFSFVANDGQSDSAPATITTTVRAVDAPPATPPVARDDSYTLIYGPPSQAQSPEVTLLTTGVFQIGAPGVLGNDSDAQNRNLSVRLAANPKNGRIQVRADGSFFYLPSSGFVGTDEFAYTLDNGQSTATARVRLTVIDRLAPELSFDTPKDGATGETISAIKGRVRDRNSGVKSISLLWRRFDGAFWNGSEWVAALTELPLTVDGIGWKYEGTLPQPGSDRASDLLEGVYQLRVTACDNSGNVSRIINRVTIESNAPQLRIDAPVTSNSETADLDAATPLLGLDAIAGRARDAEQVELVLQRVSDNAFWNGTAFTSAPARFPAELAPDGHWKADQSTAVKIPTLEQLKLGTYLITARALNNAGKMTQRQAAIQIVQTTAPNA